MTILIRADGDAQRGTGHVMRCLALAQAVEAEKGRVVFLSHCESESLRQRVEAAGILFHPLGRRHPHPADLSATLALLRELQAAWLVLDGYHFDPAYQQAVRGAGYRLLVIDDIAHLPEYHADLLLNQNLNAGQFQYAHDPDTVLLLGPRYALLRPEYLRWGGWHREIPELARKVLVTMGGGDADNVTLRIIRVLRQIRGIGVEAKVVVGPASPHLEELRRAVDGNETPLHLLTNVTDMSPLMAWADIGFAAGGSTCWELAFMGLPSVVMVLAENQDGIAAALDSAGIAMNVGWFDRVSEARLSEVLIELLMSPERRRRMSHAGQQLVDGGGAGRVVATLQASFVASCD